LTALDRSDKSEVRTMKMFAAIVAAGPIVMKDGCIEGVV
jgi:hypothetical protein